MQNNLLQYIILLAVLLLGSCGRTTQETQEVAGNTPPKPIQIAMIPKGTTHVFWNRVHAGAAKAAHELGVQLYLQGPLKEDDRQVQIQTVQNFISRGVDAIVLAPLDSRSLIPSVKAARGKQIPVIIFDSDLDATVMRVLWQPTTGKADD